MCSKAIARSSNRTLYLHNNCSILSPNIAEIILNNHNLILTMVITCMSTVKSLVQPRSYMYQPMAV